MSAILIQKRRRDKILVAAAAAVVAFRCKHKLLPEKAE